MVYVNDFAGFVVVFVHIIITVAASAVVVGVDVAIDAADGVCS